MTKMREIGPRNMHDRGKVKVREILFQKMIIIKLPNNLNVTAEGGRYRGVVVHVIIESFKIEN